MGTPFSVAVADRDGHVVVTVAGDVDLATAARFRDASLAAVGIEPTTIVIDLSEVTFMDSTGLGVLVLLRRKARSRRSRLRLVSSRATAAILKVSGLDQAFDVHPTLDAAVDSLNQT